MKKKKLLIGIIIVIVLAIALITLVLNKKTPKTNIEIVRVSFNTNGGTAIKDIKVKKNSEISLPSTAKDGYNFEGWYIDDKKVEGKITIKKNTKIVAKWEKIPEDAKTFVITFDTDGGSSIDKITLECEKEITLPSNPTKNGYTFITWQDKNETPILNGALLACEDLTLYAKWEKKEDKKEPTKVEKTKEYTCPEGYKLSDTKCTIEGVVHSKCPEGTREDADLCINLTDYNQGTRTCGEKIVNMGGGHTPSVQGIKVDAGTTFCYYGEVSDDKDTCTSRGRKWCNSLNKCFVDMDQNYSTECSNDYKYYTSNKLLVKFGAHNNGGCYKKVDKENYCDDEYSLSSGKCIKTIDANLK